MITELAHVDDAGLVRRALRGDYDAIVEMVDRYGSEIYTFNRARLPASADALSATLHTFRLAGARLAQLSEPAKLRTWLLSIAHKQIALTGLQGEGPSGEPDMEVIVDSTSGVDLLHVHSSEELWSRSDGSERDREALELHVRHGLAGQSLADVLGLSRSGAETLQSHMQQDVAVALGSLLVAREGRGECGALDQLLVAWDGQFTPQIRSLVVAHIDACVVCEEAELALLLEPDSTRILPFVEAPSHSRVDTIDTMVGVMGIARTPAARGLATMVGRLGFTENVAIDQGAVSSGHWQSNGFPSIVPEETTRRVVVLSAVAAFVALLALSGGLALVLDNSVDETSKAAVEVAGVVQSAEVGRRLADATATTDRLTDATAQETSAVGPETSATPSVDSAAAIVDIDEQSDQSTESTASTTTGVPGVAQTEGTSPSTTTSTAEAPVSPASTVTTPPAQSPAAAVESSTPSTTVVNRTTSTVVEAATTTATPSSTNGPTTTVAPTSTTATPSTTIEPTSTTATPSTTIEPTSTTATPSTTIEPTTTTSTTATPQTNQAPVFNDVTVSVGRVEASRGACAGGTVVVTVSVDDADGEVSDVVAEWDSGIDGVRRATLTPSSEAGPGTFRGVIGVWAKPGRKSPTITATDNDGVSTSRNIAIQVTGCSSG